MTDDDLKRLLETMRQESAAAQTETHRRFDAAVARMEAAHAETRRHFDVVIERAEGRVDHLAESLAQVDEKLDRRADELEERMERGFSETQAMMPTCSRGSSALKARLTSADLTLLRFSA